MRLESQEFLGAGQTGGVWRKLQSGRERVALLGGHLTGLLAQQGGACLGRELSGGTAWLEVPAGLVLWRLSMGQAAEPVLSCLPPSET